MNLYYKEISLGCKRVASFLGNIFEDLPEGGRFYCNIIRAQGPEAYISRTGEWSDPFNTTVFPGMEIPNYNSFGLNFEEVTDRRALDIKNLINTSGRKVVLSYSGGIDSTVCLVSLIKNLSKAELNNVVVSLTAESIIENPDFYRIHIKDKLAVVDLTTYYNSDFILDHNHFLISADLGDFILGTELATKMYPQIPSLEKQLGKRTSLYKHVCDPEINYSKYKDVIVLYLNNVLKNSLRGIAELPSINKSLLELTDKDLQYGELFYEKIHKNIRTSHVPVNSLHDFFWWTMFNTKFMWGALRAGINYSKGTGLDKILNDGVIPWYGSKEYQLWSMTCNITEKINGITQSDYKWAPRKYIYDFDKNEWYFKHKIKISSGPILMKQNWWKNYKDFDRRIGVDTSYKVIMLDDPGVNDAIATSLYNYKIDWI